MRNLIKNVFHKRNKSGGIHQHQINSEIADLLIKTNLKSLALAALIASLLIYLQIGSENISACLSWFGILSGAYLLHHLISHVYFKKNIHIYSRYWLYYFRFITTLLGVVWGASSLFFFHLNDYLHQAFLAMSLAMICGGAIVVYALDRYASISFACGLISSFLPPYLNSADMFSIAIGLMFTTFVLYMTLAVVNFGNTLRENIALRIQSNIHKEEIERLAYYDALTNTPNRRLLADRLNHSLKLSQRSKSFIAVMFLDLDNFKTLNDSKGHAVGDLLLKQVAKRLEKSTRNHDTVARIGGDEFVVVLEDLGTHLGAAKNAIKSIAQKVLKEINKPFVFDHHEHICSPSIGIYMCAGEDITVDEVLKRADAAMYQVKQSGRNNFAFYDISIQPTLDLLANLKSDLHLALIHQQLEIYFQPQVNDKEQIIGAEALLRWHHPELGTISPTKFIPLAEETGLIIPIGIWVLQQSCIQLKKWNDQVENIHLRIAVNVSALQFAQNDFVSQVETAIKQSGCNPRKLMLELTESLVVKNVDAVVNKMQSLKTMGVLLSLDDFGIGYSSLSLLKQLPLDELKIDQSFVSEALENPNSALIVQTIISMGRSLGIEVIAEGVAKKGQELFLKAAGCKTYQGYLFGKPKQIKNFEKAMLSPHRIH